MENVYGQFRIQRRRKMVDINAEAYKLIDYISYLTRVQEKERERAKHGVCMLTRIYF